MFESLEFLQNVTWLSVATSLMGAGGLALNRKILKRGRDRELGQRTLAWIQSDFRRAIFWEANYFSQYEEVEGDILEFGVGTGLSLAVLALTHKEMVGHWFSKKGGLQRRIVGFDSFQGLPASRDSHPGVSKKESSRNPYPQHPILAVGDSLRPEAVLELFEVAGLTRPRLEVGPYERTLSRVSKKYPKAAIVHVSCFTYESARRILKEIEKSLQDGTVLLFTEWFCYRGSPVRGEARAFNEFLRKHPRWKAVPYKTYGVYGNSFILHDARRSYRRRARRI